MHIAMSQIAQRRRRVKKVAESTPTRENRARQGPRQGVKRVGES